MSLLKRKVTAILNSPNNTKVDIREACKDLTITDKIQVDVGSGYDSQPEQIILLLEEWYPGKTFDYIIRHLRGRKYIDVFLKETNSMGKKTRPGQLVRMYPSQALVDPFNLSIKDIHIGDIAHHLSRICLFRGGVPGLYSVAEHSMKVASMVSPVHKPWALMHDAYKAFLGDVIRPVKERFDGQLDPVEQSILSLIAVNFGLSAEIPQSVWDAKVEARLIETEQIRQNRLLGNTYWVSEEMFLASFNKYVKPLMK